MLIFAGCGQTDIIQSMLNTNDPITQRWYSETQLAQGTRLYATYCAQCHGARAQGVFNPENKQLPVPPLDDKGHLWRTNIERYMQIAKNGKGRMPASGLQNDKETLLVLAAIQQHWSDRKYQLWQQVQQALH